MSKITVAYEYYHPLDNKRYQNTCETKSLPVFEEVIIKWLATEENKSVDEISKYVTFKVID